MTLLGSNLRRLTFGLFYLTAITLSGQNQPAVANNPDSLSRVLNNKGVDYAMEGNLERASDMFGQSLRLKQTIIGFDRNRLASGYINLANIKFELGYVDSALHYYRTAERYLLESENPDITLHGVMLAETGSCLLQLQDVKSAILHIRQGINLIEGMPNPDWDKLILIYLKLITALGHANQTEDAILEGQKALAYANGHNAKLAFYIYKNIGNTFRVSGDNAASMVYYKKAEEVSRRFGLSAFQVAGLSVSMGLGFQHNKQFAEAWKYYQNALRIYTARNDKNRLASLHVTIGRLMLEQDSIERSIERFIQSIELNLSTSPGADYYSISADGFVSPTVALFSFSGIGDAQYRIYQKNGKIESLLSAYRSYTKAINLVSEIRMELIGEEDMLQFTNRLYKLYEKAVDAAATLYSLKLLDHNALFSIMSRGKSAVLNEQIRNQKGLRIAGIPLALQDRELSLRQRIGVLSERLYEEQKGLDVISIYPRQHLSLLLSAKSDYANLINSFEKDYPEYFRLKFGSSSVSLEQLKMRLSEKQVLIDYFKTDSTLYTLVVGKTYSRFLVQQLEANFYDNLDRFFGELVPNDFNSLDQSNVQRFADASYAVYSTLIKPFEREIAGKALIIVPHDIINSIPFAALTTNPVVDAKGFYRLPYLMLRNPISYNYSSAEILEHTLGRPNHFIKSLSVAPKYNGVQAGHTQWGKYRENLPELFGALQEANYVSQTMNGSTLAGDSATEGNFKRLSGKFDVLHFAMHTHIDPKDALYSKLIFSSSPDTAEDGYLNAYEIYNLTLICRLAVLSACRSGDGNLVKGEGLISLARGFSYAGCPTLITTLWGIDDHSGFELMKAFIATLARGESVNTSLQKAQTDYLELADPLRSHPYFWAAFQVYGDNSPVTNGGKSLFGLVGIFLVALFLHFYPIFFVVRNRNRKVAKPSAAVGFQKR